MERRERLTAASVTATVPASESPCLGADSRGPIDARKIKCAAITFGGRVEDLNAAKINPAIVLASALPPASVEQAQEDREPAQTKEWDLHSLERLSAFLSAVEITTASYIGPLSVGTVVWRGQIDDLNPPAVVGASFASSCDELQIAPAAISNKKLEVPKEPSSYLNRSRRCSAGITMGVKP